MDFALSNALIRRGAIYLIHNVDFGDRSKAKFVVLLEDICQGKKTILGAFTTSHTEYHYIVSTVLIESSKCSLFTENTLIQCENTHEFSIDFFNNNAKAKYIGNIGEDYLK